MPRSCKSDFPETGDAASAAIFSTRKAGRHRSLRPIIPEFCPRSPQHSEIALDYVDYNWNQLVRKAPFIGDVGVVRPVAAGVEQRMGTAAFGGAGDDVVQGRVERSVASVGIAFSIPVGIEQRARLNFPRATLQAPAAQQITDGVSFEHSGGAAKRVGDGARTGAMVPELGVVIDRFSSGFMAVGAGFVGLRLAEADKFVEDVGHGVSRMTMGMSRRMEVRLPRTVALP